MASILGGLLGGNTWKRDDYCRSAVSGGHRLRSGNDAEKDAFVQVRALILRKEQSTEKFNANINTIKDFTIFLSQQYATYTNPDTHDIKRIDLLSIEDNTIQAALKDYYTASGAEKWQKGWAVIAHSKGDQHGATPLNTKEDGTLDKLKRTHTLDHAFKELLPQMLSEIPTSDPGVKATVARRLLFVEYFQAKMLKMVGDRYTAKQTELRGAGNDTQANILQRELSDLRKLHEQISSLDTYALFKVLSVYPTGRVTNVRMEQIAEDLKDQVTQDIQGDASLASKVKSKFTGKPAEPTQVQKAYAQDVAGMLFMDRGGYFSYCDKHHLPKKKEGIADVFLREAIKFASQPEYLPGTEYAAEGFQRSTMIHYFAESHRAEMKDEISKLGVIASHAIKGPEGAEYTTEQHEQYPAGATDADKKAIDKRNAAKVKENAAALQSHITAHRARVDNNFTYAQVPAPQPSQGLVTPSRIAAAATGAVVATQVAPRVFQAIRDAGEYAIPRAMPYVESARQVVMPRVGPVLERARQAVMPTVRAVGQALTPAVNAVSQALVPYVPANISALPTQMLAPVMGAMNYVGQYPARVILGATVANKVCTMTLEQVYPKQRNPKDGVVRRKLKPAQFALALGTTAVVLHTGLKMYQAVTDGVIDHSFYEVAGEYAITGMQSSANAVDFIWNNAVVQLHWTVTAGVTTLYAWYKNKDKEPTKLNVPGVGEVEIGWKEQAVIQTGMNTMMGGFPILTPLIEGATEAKKAGDKVLPRPVQALVNAATDTPLQTATNIATAKGAMFQAHQTIALANLGISLLSGTSSIVVGIVGFGARQVQRFWNWI